VSGSDKSAGAADQDAPLKEDDPKRIEADVIGTLKTCYDPEIPVDIYELGLIYEVNVSADAHVEVKMTLTSPMCPVAGTLPPEVEQKIRGVHGVKSARVEVVWDPPWDQEMMSEAARVTLGFF
jgi:FeS assembly SUF system protein